jgi:hypothetical protein
VIVGNTAGNFQVRFGARQALLIQDEVTSPDTGRTVINGKYDAGTVFDLSLQSATGTSTFDIKLWTDGETIRSSSFFINGSPIVTLSPTQNDVLAAFRPSTDAGVNLGQAGLRWNNIFAASDVINTSDERVKRNINDMDDALFEAWKDVRYRVFQFRDAVEEKGEAGARLHAGVVAQEIMKVFARNGLDASRYGLFCYDSWDDQYDVVVIQDAPAVYKTDAKGKLVLDVDGGPIVETPEKTHIERGGLIRPAGELYSIRYSEVFALEAAYQRRILAKFEARISALEEDR